MTKEKCLHCAGELELKYDDNKICWYTYYYCDACMASGHDNEEEILISLGYYEEGE